MTADQTTRKAARPNRIRREQDPLSRARKAVGDRLSAVPLRVTLVLALVISAALGLLVSGLAVTSSLQNSLMNRTDQQLADAAMSRVRAIRPALPAPPPDQRGTPTTFYVTTEYADGAGTFVSKPFDVEAVPDLTAVSAAHPVTVDSLNGDPTRWRVVQVRTPDVATTVALPLTQNDDTVRRLVMLQVAVGSAVLAVLALAAYFVIRRSLLPLRRVENIAAAIAKGDLHRRVPVRGNDTEVDRLSRSLNGMLAQIQSAFAATEASEAAARDSEATMRRFVADASHELRTPLTTIRGFAELYRQGATDDPVLVLDRIEREAQRMGVLVEDLLMLARLDAQRPLERGPVDLLTLAGDAVHSARAVAAATATDRRITLEVRSGKGTLEVDGDETRLRQVLANLVNNALTHTPPDADITVALTPELYDVVLEVADTGPGLPPDEADRVFERFYRTDTSRTRASGGTGLGLSIVRALVEAHGGTVGVRSVPGEGTIFTVRLPRDA
ncbi:two-component system OmpR family sensor kinase [Nocardia puris]|uniref:histidine kinase n=1 Tax=Nocardia puris TaxID=208602 RepID=A0A366DBT7_9NOCA|nr:two-component system OmpR family sensor kinase [Nocardia puris]